MGVAMSKSYAKSSHLSVGNEKVELKIDSRTGFIRDIFNKETGLHHKANRSGIWPFGLRMGNGYAPDLSRIQIDDADACADQHMTYEIAGDEGCTVLRMIYDDMVTVGGSATGIRQTV